MNRFKTLLTISVFSILVLGLPTLASAQWRDRDNDDYGRNRNGNYYGNLKDIIKELKNDSKDFRKNIKREVERDRYNSGANLKYMAEDFEKAADRLKDEFDENASTKAMMKPII